MSMGIELGLIDLAILWSLSLIALSCFIINVSSEKRGIAPPIMTGLIFLLVFLMAGMFTYIKISTMKDDLNDIIESSKEGRNEVFVEEGEQKSETTGTNLEIPSAEDVAEVLAKKEESKKEEAFLEYKQEVLDILKEGLSISKRINYFNVGDLETISLAGYEEKQNIAMSLRSQANAISRKLKVLDPPTGYKEYQARIDDAAEKLRLAGYSLYKFFNAENESEERSFRKQFAYQASQATKGLVSIQKSLEAK